MTFIPHEVREHIAIKLTSRNKLFWFANQRTERSSVMNIHILTNSKPMENVGGKQLHMFTKNLNVFVESNPYGKVKHIFVYLIERLTPRLY